MATAPKFKEFTPMIKYKYQAPHAFTVVVTGPDTAGKRSFLEAISRVPNANVHEERLHVGDDLTATVGTIRGEDAQIRVVVLPLVEDTPESRHILEEVVDAWIVLVDGSDVLQRNVASHYVAPFADLQPGLIGLSNVQRSTDDPELLGTGGTPVYPWRTAQSSTDLMAMLTAILNDKLEILDSIV